MLVTAYYVSFQFCSGTIRTEDMGAVLTELNKFTSVEGEFRQLNCNQLVNQVHSPSWPAILVLIETILTANQDLDSCISQPQTLSSYVLLVFPP